MPSPSPSCSRNSPGPSASRSTPLPRNPGTTGSHRCTNEPQARFDHTAVWTGTEMIIWGGDCGGFSCPPTGGRHDPAYDTWNPTTTDFSDGTDRPNGHPCP